MSMKRERVWKQNSPGQLMGGRVLLAQERKAAYRRPALSGAVVLNLSRHQNRLENVLKHRLLSLVPRCSHSVGLRWGREFACLTSSQVMLMLVVQGPPLRSTGVENRCVWRLQNKALVGLGIWYFTDLGQSGEGVYLVDGTQDRSHYWMQRAQLIGRNMMSAAQGVD